MIKLKLEHGKFGIANTSGVKVTATDTKTDKSVDLIFDAPGIDRMATIRLNKLMIDIADTFNSLSDRIVQD